MQFLIPAGTAGTAPQERELMRKQPPLQPRVVEAAEKLLARQKFVTPLDVCIGLGWLNSSLVDDWKQGRKAALEQVLPVRGDRLADFFACLERWTGTKGLKASEAEYVSQTRDRRALRFTDKGDPQAEAAWRTHWVSPGLTGAQEKRIAKRKEVQPDLVVISPAKEFTCAACAETYDGLLIMDNKGPLCLACADMDHLMFLPAGDAAMTRRAKKASRLSAVVVRWSKARKRYERQGLLVEEAALEQAEQECLADADIRERRREREAGRRADMDVEFAGRFASEIARLYPGCPAGRAAEIARHAGERSSGRVGRSAAGRDLEERAVTLAVVASIRHLDTDYDDLLMSGVERAEARERIRPAIDKVLAAWRSQDG
jgi:hypothetical protein